jgi:hypothetical protein
MQGPQTTTVTRQRPANYNRGMCSLRGPLINNEQQRNSVFCAVGAEII